MDTKLVKQAFKLGYQAGLKKLAQMVSPAAPKPKPLSKGKQPRPPLQMARGSGYRPQLSNFRKTWASADNAQKLKLLGQLRSNVAKLQPEMGGRIKRDLETITGYKIDADSLQQQKPVAQARPPKQNLALNPLNSGINAIMQSGLTQIPGVQIPGVQ